MERTILSPAEALGVVGRQSTKIAAGIAGGGIAAAPFLEGKLDKTADLVGAAAFCYAAVRVYRYKRSKRRHDSQSK